MLEKNQPGLESKRNSLYACLLTYSAEYGSLRHRAIDRMVLGALLGSEIAKPYKVGEIQKNLRCTPTFPEIRIEVIKDALSRLGKVGKVEKKGEKAYYLSEVGANELGKQIEKASELFDIVAGKMLEDTQAFVSYEIGSDVCRRFISECFARFGKKIAQGVSGEDGRDDTITSGDINAAFEYAVHKHALTEEAKVSLEARCIAFLKSIDPTDKKLKFFLTQSYYFTQLIGLERAKFNPLSDEAFANSVIYLDANLIIPYIISTEHLSGLFNEMVQISKRIGIELRVTRATINEARGVAADKSNSLNQIVPSIPEKALEHWSSDQFLSEYMNAKALKPSLTLEQFLEPFDRLADILRQMGICIDDRVESDILQGRQFAEIKKVFNEISLDIRGYAKSQNVLTHDICHYALILDERRTNPKTWFLSRDRALIQAARQLASNDFPFCFSISGFLQSISPFLSSSEDENAMGDIFTAFLNDQLLPAEQIFDIKELQLIAEVHGDILSTPTENLIRAFDFAKRTVLMGNPYNTSDVPQVALALRKFLSSSADEQRRVLADATEKLETQLNEEKQQRMVDGQDYKLKFEQYKIDNEAKVSRAQQEADRVLEAKNQALRTEHEKLNSIDRENQSLKTEVYRIYYFSRLILMLLGFILGVVTLIYYDDIFSALTRKWSHYRISLISVKLVLGFLMSSFFLLFSVPFIKNLRYAKEYRIGLLAVIATVAFGVSRMLSEEAWASWSAYAQVAGLAAPLIYLLSSKTERSGEDDTAPRANSGK